MLNPYVSDSIAVKNLGGAQFIVWAKSDMDSDHIVEVCPVSILTKKEAIVLQKTIPWAKDKIFVDQQVLDSEFGVLSQLNEMELEKRLDRGEITGDQFRQMLISKISSQGLLESKSHVLMLGNGLLYRISELPNLVCEYHEKDKVCVFKTIRFVSRGSELTYYKQN